MPGAFDIKPLDDALGADISGIDFSAPLNAQTAAAIRTALLEYHLVCLRTTALSPAVFDRLARQFGDPQVQLLREHRDATVPSVSVFDSTYQTVDSKPDDLRLDRRSGWHTDDSYFEIPAKITLLQALAIPTRGGETRFCNAVRAFDDLAGGEQERLANYLAIHSYDTARAPARAVKRTAAEAEETPDIVHPLIRTHEESGKKAIYFNSNRTDRIVGLEREHSDRELDALHAHMTQPKYQYHHEWRLGDILMWDNRSVTHSVNMDFPVGEKRVHQRILLAGTRPS